MVPACVDVPRDVHAGGLMRKTNARTPSSIKASMRKAIRAARIKFLQYVFNAWEINSMLLF